MKVTVDLNATRLLDRVKNAPKRVLYVTEKALNQTALEVQAAIQKRVLGEFTVRQKQFITRQAAKIEKKGFASVKANKMYVEVAVGRVKEGGRELLLGGFEKGMVREPFVGKSVAFPTVGGPARRTLGAKVPRAWTFEALQFRQARTRTDLEKGRIGKGSRTKAGTKRKPQWVSARQDAYLIPGVGVFQRRGGESKLVYYFVPKLTLDQRLDFVMTARRTIAKRFAPNLRAWIKEALEYDAVRRVGK